MASPASAATTIGSASIASAPSGSAPCSPCPQTLIQDTIGGSRVTAPAGVIVRFRFKGEGPVAVVAYRPSLRSDTRLVATKVGVSAPVSGGGASEVVTGTAQIPVQSGDMVGLVLRSGALVYARTQAAGSRVWAVPEGDAAIDTQNARQAELLFQADVEPDANGNGLGDETQEGGATPAALKLPALSALTARATTTGNVPLRLRNRNAYAITGRVTLKRGGTTVGKASYSLAAGESRTVRVKLNRATRTRLRRARTLKLKLTITARGPTGASPRSTTKTLTVRRP